MYLAIVGFSKYRNSTLAALAEGGLKWFDVVRFSRMEFMQAVLIFSQSSEWSILSCCVLGQDPF